MESFALKQDSREKYTRQAFQYFMMTLQHVAATTRPTVVSARIAHFAQSLGRQGNGWESSRCARQKLRRCNNSPSESCLPGVVYTRTIPSGEIECRSGPHCAHLCAHRRLRRKRAHVRPAQAWTLHARAGLFHP